MLKGREIFIAGGGIAGFAAALALAQRGARVTLAEQSRGVSGSGAMDGSTSGPPAPAGQPERAQEGTRPGPGAKTAAAARPLAAVPAASDSDTVERPSSLASVPVAGNGKFSESRAPGAPSAPPAAADTWRGGGLQVSPNGTRVLMALGLGSQLRARSREAAAVRLHDGFTGHRILRIPFSRGADGAGYHLFRRAELVGMLAEAAQEAGVELLRPARVEWPGAPVPDGDESGAPLRLRVGGQAREVELALAADGIHSQARALLNGAGAPFFTGQVAWRAIIPDDAPTDAPAEARVFLGPGMHLVTTPLTGGGRNLVAVVEREAWAAEGWDHADDPEALRREFSSFAPEVQGWLAQVDEVRLWGLFRHPIASHWHGARVALLGDAAHPTLPFMAQGANMALEDAWLLAAALDALPAELALPRWQALRAPRVRRAIAAADANARNYHLRGLARYGAHRALWLGGMLAPGLVLSRLRWLYDYDVTAARI